MAAPQTEIETRDLAVQAFDTTRLTNAQIARALRKSPSTIREWRKAHDAHPAPTLGVTLSREIERLGVNELEERMSNEFEGVDPNDPVASIDKRIAEHRRLPNFLIPRARRVRPIPKGTCMDWLVNWPVHVATGALGGAGIVLGDEFLGLTLPFFFLLLYSAFRQFVEYLRRDDTPGRDLGQVMGGMVAGILFGVWVLAQHRNLEWLPDYLKVF